MSYISPDRIVENKGVFFISEFYISYYDQYTIYELPYHVTSEINNKLIYDSTKYEYYVSNNNTKKGYLIKNLNDSFGKKISDSIVIPRAMNGGPGNVDLFSELKIRKMSKLRDTSATIYNYLFDNYFYDSAYFQYKAELKDVKFSFSKALDSSYHSKLSKVQLFIKHNVDTVPPGLQDFYINSFEMEKVPGKDAAALKNLVERFIQAEKRNKE